MHLLSPARPRHLYRALLAGASALILLALGLSFAQKAEAIAPPIPLGTAEQYAVLAGAGVTNTGPTTITSTDADVRGDVGTSPTDTITGDDSISWVLPATGDFHRADAAAAQAQLDAGTAYGVAAGAASDQALGAQLDGVSLAPGVHTASSALDLAVNGTVTLDADGDEDAVFVIQVGSSLTLGSGSTVALVNGAQACRVFWQISDDATIGTDATFRGTMLAENAIVAQTGADIEGRLLAQNAAVTLDTNTFTVPTCEAGDTDAEADGTDADGTDADGTDADGTDADADGTDADGTDADADGTDADADGTDADAGADADADATDADAGPDADGTGAGPGAEDADADADSGTPLLPDTGGPAGALLPIGVALVALGAAAVSWGRVRGTHRA